MDAKDNASLTSRAQDKGESNLSRASGVRPSHNFVGTTRHISKKSSNFALDFGRVHFFVRAIT